MRAVLKTSPQHGVEYTASHPEPAPGPGEVLLEVAAASVCGTDRELFEWGAAAEAFDLELPVVLGHELAGTVIAVGPEVRRLREGDRVALESHVPCGHCFPCRTGDAHNCANLRILGMHVDGGFAQRMAAPVERLLRRCPSRSRWRQARCSSPPGWRCTPIQRYGMAVAGGVVLVNGCGPVGLVIAELCRPDGRRPRGGRRAEPLPPRPGRARGGAGPAPVGRQSPSAAASSRASRQGADVAFEVSAAAGRLPGALRRGPPRGHRRRGRPPGRADAGRHRRAASTRRASRCAGSSAGGCGTPGRRCCCSSSPAGSTSTRS